MAERSNQPSPKLTRLEMHGFKSFAAKTVVEFKTGITAVVGPNGSGKSNIADAVRWVLGETSYSALRSKKTEDVIFAGGKGKSPSGMAEVTVTFNNEDRWLPSEFTEVTVTRRAFRGGSGEYLINGRKVRLKDVTHLTAGLGHSYTVVGQGLVDAALSQRAEERRGLFEHAANLSALRMRVQEGERNLAETDTNTTRLTDLLGQVEPNLKRLERAARQHKEWKDLRDRQQFLQRGHYRRLLLAAIERLTSAETAAAYDQTALDDAQRTLDALIAGRPALEQTLHSATQALERHDARLGELREQHRTTAHSKDLVEERLGSMGRIESDAESTRAGLQEQLAATEKRLTEVTSAIEHLTSELTSAQAAVYQQQQTAELARSERRSAEQELRDQTSQALQIERRIADLQQQRALLIQKRETSAVDADRLRAEAQDRDDRLATLTTELAEREQADNQFTDQLAKLDEQINDLRARSEQQSTAGSALAATLAQLDKQLGQASNRLDVLQRMHDSGEGLYQGPRQVMSWHRQGKLSGIRGTLQELITVPTTYDTALETALGGHLQDIVVNAWRDAETAIGMLKNARAGRATFQPIETVKRRGGHRPPPREIEGVSGVHGVASDLVQCDADVAEVVQALLGRFVIVDDLPTSRRMMDVLPGGWSTVTLAGEIARSGGSVTGGAQVRDTGVLKRERELKELPGTLRSLEQERNKAEKSLSEHAITVKQAASEREAAERERAGILAEQRAAGPQKDRLRAWISEITTQRSAAERHAQAAAIGGEERDQRIATLAAEIEANTVRLTELRDAEAALAESISERRDSTSDVEAALADATTTLAALEERKRAEERQRGQLQGQIRAQRTEIDSREERAAELAGRKVALREERERLERDVAALADSVSAGERARVPLAESMSAAAGAVRQQQADIEQARQTTMERERSMGQKGLALERAKSETQSIHQRIIDDLNYEIPDDLVSDTEQQDYSALPDDYDETEREIGRLRNRLHRVGYVGDNVMEEYEEEAERFAFLTEQLTDVKQAAARLREMLAELQETMQRRFEETFELVSIEFSKAFEVLFGGGTARLVLAPDDEGAPGGIDIVAQPPGKRLQGLALLSGGERSLTAVALLFAILRVNPTPFVLLDEVDAALDEANVVRFRDELRTLAHESQAIVITHNRGTVEIADTLYGITMGGDGVSQTLSLRLDDIPLEDDFDVRDLAAVSAGLPVR